MTTDAKRLRAERLNRRILLAFAAFGLVVVAGLVYGSILGRRHQASYRQLRLGMSRAEVEAAFGKRPDCETQVGKARVVHFVDPFFGIGRGRMGSCSKVLPSYSSPSQLPMVYGSAQVGLTQDGRVSAFTLMGHERAQTRAGDKQYWSLDELPLEALE